MHKRNQNRSKQYQDWSNKRIFSFSILGAEAGIPSDRFLPLACGKACQEWGIHIPAKVKMVPFAQNENTV
jgi:hypothetical protein